MRRSVRSFIDAVISIAFVVLMAVLAAGGGPVLHVLNGGVP